jgi:hypothetical protein
MNMTLGRKAIVRPVRRAVGPSVLVLFIAIWLVIVTKNGGWLSVGGAVISAFGARLWANRIFRQRPERADDPLPPAALPQEPGARGVQLNWDYFAVAHQRALDNWLGLVGVWLSIAGGIIGSAGPFLLGFVWHPSTP